jgi:hypothetical protein
MNPTRIYVRKRRRRKKFWGVTMMNRRLRQITAR